MEIRGGAPPNSAIDRGPADTRGVEFHLHRSAKALSRSCSFDFHLFRFGWGLRFACARSDPATVFSSFADLLSLSSLLAFLAGRLPVTMSYLLTQ